MKKIILCLVMVGLLNACATDQYTGESKVSKTAWGTGIGAAVGAGVGALIGGEKGALIGAGIGGVTGAATGGYMDIQASKLGEKLRGTGVQVMRDGDNIRLIMPNSITFNTNDDTMKTSANAVLLLQSLRERISSRAISAKPLLLNTPRLQRNFSNQRVWMLM